MNKVCLGIPTGDFIRMNTVMTLLSLVLKNRDIKGATIEHGPYIHINRDNIILKALKTDYTHVFFIDTDVCFNSQVLERLLLRDKDIVGTIYNLKKLPLEPIIRKKNDKGELVGGKREDLPEDLFKAYALGTGCMLIKIDVFRNIKRPWFFHEKWDDENEGMGEDIWFCTRAHEAGYDIWCDPTVEIGHVANTIY